MKPTHVLIFLLTLLSLPVHAADIEVWAAPAIYKVRPDQPSQNSNLVWNAKTKTISVAGAKNEHLPFQVVVSTPPPPTRYHQAASGFFVEASDLVSSNGRISRDRIRLYVQHAVLCYGKSSPIGETGFWPDALAPLTDPFSMAAEFRYFVKNRAIWIDVVTPADVPAGDYAGNIRVTHNGQPVNELKLKLKVFDFALPAETHLITHMGISARQLAVTHNVPPGSPAAKELLRKYHAFLYENRMEPWFNEGLQPEIVERGDDVTLKFDAQSYDLYMNRWKTRRVILEAVPSELARGAREPEFSEATARRVRSYLRQTADYYRKNGWLERLVFNSPIDEPNTAQAYEDTRKWAKLVHEAAPGVPFLVTEAPVTDDPAWGALNGYANNFSVHGNELNRLEVKEAIHREQARGGEITWYISCDQVYPQPNYFIDAPAMDPVMVPWITLRYGMNGVLYWAFNFWSQTPDPWLDPVTYLSGFLCSNGGILNGEGSLLYPGNRVRRYTGQKNVDGPVSSIRFELLREGIEDYEYLWMLKSLGDQKSADEIVKSMVVDVSAFSRNVEELFAVRERMAKRIEQLARNKR
ncbi:MAG TPA: DUF4091 domain-containing protein [Bryobacteraceae bacterium]|nr:DUF4091 domain-containing protein [Bryobacteraceae bacterium]